MGHPVVSGGGAPPSHARAAAGVVDPPGQGRGGAGLGRLDLKAVGAGLDDTRRRAFGAVRQEVHRAARAVGAVAHGTQTEESRQGVGARVADHEARAGVHAAPDLRQEGGGGGVAIHQHRHAVAVAPAKGCVRHQIGLHAAFAIPALDVAREGFGVGALAGRHRVHGIDNGNIRRPQAEGPKAEEERKEEAGRPQGQALWR